MKYLNIACGKTFIDNEDWINIDFTTNTPSIKKANLFKGLSFRDNSFDVVYSSHFIEHIPKEHLEIFLADCLRVLKPNGVIRLVTPDLEFLINEYVENIKSKKHFKANFIAELLLDQCVRLTSGGNLAKLIHEIKNSDDSDTKAYVIKLLGPDIFEDIHISSESYINKALNKVRKDPKIIINILSMVWIRSIIKLLPKSFRNTNVSLASIGEKHMWVYDFLNLSKSLNKVGFSDSKKLTFKETTFENYIFSELDISNTLPRKGIHQLFVEARK